MCCGKGKTPLCYPKQNMCTEQSRSSKRLFAFTHLSKSKKAPSCECDLNKDKVTCEVPALDDTKIASHLLLLSFLSKKPWNYLAQPMICRIKQPLQLHIIFSLCSHECPPMCLWSRRSMSVIWCLAANVGFWGMCGLCWDRRAELMGGSAFSAERALVGASAWAQVTLSTLKVLSGINKKAVKPVISRRTSMTNVLTLLF